MEENAAACPLVRGQHILVALDGSPPSELALTQAVSLGKQCNSQIFLLSVIELYPEQLQYAHALEEKLSVQAREVLDRAKAQVEAENIACETLVAIDGQPHNAIVQQARNNDVDLIVLGSHGRSGLKKLMMGSVAAKVIGHAPCAVMVIPNL